MNNEQQELLNEAYENYCTTLIGSITFSERGKHFKSNGLEFNSGYPNYVHYSHEEFIDKCKTDTDFSERWGLKIDEKELTWDERHELAETKYQIDDVDDVLDKEGIPTKLITITYNGKTIESYEFTRKD
jgi:hypothetical protein